MSIVSVAELGIWTQQTLDDDDPFANAVLDLASGLVADHAQHPDWLEDTPPPYKAKVICLRLARRTFVNTDGEIASAVGPISGRVLDEMAASMRLTEDEEEDLEGMRGDPDDLSDPKGLWVLTTSPGVDLIDRTAFAFDSSGSDWGIPMTDFAESDAMVTDDDTLVP